MLQSSPSAKEAPTVGEVSPWKAGQCPNTALREEYALLSSKRDNKPSIASSPLALDNKGFKTPKEVIAALIIIGQAKLQMKLTKMLALAFLGGVYTGIGGICATVALTGLPGFNESFPVIPKFLSALVWPVGLTFVVVCGAELYQGNCMTCSVAWIHALVLKKNHKKYHKLLPMNLVLVLLMNSLGAVSASYFFGYLTEIFSHEPYLSGVKTIAIAKTSYGWGAAFLRGVACNQVVCLGIFMAISAQDIFSKTLASYIAIFTFVFSGYDGGISNMVTVPLSLLYGAQTTFWAFLWRNFIPAVLGNFVGGFLLVAMLYYWLYYFSLNKNK